MTWDGNVWQGSEKSYAVSLGLAKEGKGRMSAEALAAVEKAKAEGKTFAGRPQPTTSRQPRPEAVVRTKVVRPSTVDAKAVRKWARENGHEVNERGRLNLSVLDAYLAAHKGNPASMPQQSAVKPPPVPVRPQDRAYVRILASDAEKARGISEPVMEITACHRCRKGIRYCQCSEGIGAPTWNGTSFGPVVLRRDQA